MRFKVAAIDDPQFFSIEEKADGTYKPVGGYEYEFLKVLSKTLDFSYEIVSPKKGFWGSEEEDGNWTGMLGMLQHNEADLVIENMYLREEATKAADFSVPYRIDRLTYCIKAAEESPKTFVYLFPFKISTWTMIILTILICTLVCFLLQRERTNCNWERTMASSAEMAIGSKRLGDKPQNIWQLKIFLSFYLLPISVLLYGYKGLFLSFLMAPVMDSQIDSLQDLVVASEKEKVKITTYIEFVDQFLSYNDSTMLTLTKHLRKHPDDIPPSDGNAVPWIRKGYVIADSENSFKLHGYSSGAMNQIFIFLDSIQLCPIAIAFGKSFCCKKRFNEIVHRIVQSGIYQKILNHHMFRLQYKFQKPEIREEVRSLSIADVHGAFWIVLPCYIMSILVFIFEYYISLTRKHKRYQQRTVAWQHSMRRNE